MDDFKVPILPSAAGAKNEPAIGERQNEKTSKTQPPTGCPYKVPKWSKPPEADQNYGLEVLKSGQIIDEVKQLQQQAIWSFGRLPDNDVEMAHPTISRYHAVLQYKPRENSEEDEETSEETAKSDQPEGWYIYDLGSTHGTYLNKQRLPARVYIRVRVGHMLKLGSSTRVYILQGPSEDEEPESELTVTELREKRERDLAEAAAEKERKILEAEERERNEGASWGMAEDADEETDLTHNPYATTNNEELFFDDPKKTLRGYFEREGLDLEYKCDELSQGSFVCRVELPLDDSNGRPIVVEVTHKGRKKDCVVQCALEACRTLDRHGVLRQANQESQKRKTVKGRHSDDEDEFWDRTGDVERKKQRMENTGTSVTLTYEDLLKQESELNSELQRVEQEINAYQVNEKRLKELALQQQNAGDDLDNFMDTLSENVTQVDKTEIKKMRMEAQRIKVEQHKLQRLIKIARPTELPFSASSTSVSTASKQESSATKKQLPMIGKRNQFSKFKVVKAQTSSKPLAQTNVFASDEEEVEGEEEPAEAKTEALTKPSTSKDLIETKAAVKSEVDLNNSIAATDVDNKDNVALSIEATAEMPNAIDKTPTDTTCASAEKEKATTEVEVVAEAEPEPESEESAHKKRRRARQRNKQRPDVDMDVNELEEHEDSDKYAKWLPPSNQSGDGFTHLNDKFGY